MWSTANNNNNKGQIVDASMYNGGDIIDDDDAFDLDDFFHVHNVESQQFAEQNMQQLGGNTADTVFQQNLPGIINIDTDDDGDQVIDLTPFLNSGYNFKIKTNDSATDHNQIEIKSYANPDGGPQEFEIPASILGQHGITI